MKQGRFLNYFRVMQPSHDIPASFVVFLVALPLCMGVAIASGAPPALGLITGIVGGIVAGALSGAPLQVSGPAAGLTVLVYSIVNEYGLAALGVAALAAGILQLFAGIFKIGRWFRAISPAVIYGMLAGIGIIIFASQFHVMMDDTPNSNVLENLITIPAAIYKGLFTPQTAGSTHQNAAVIGIISIATIFLWDSFRPKFLKAIPSALLAVLIATGITLLFDFPVTKVNIPENIFSSIQLPSFDSLYLLHDIGFLHLCIGMAIIASAETLLCATAVDKMHHGATTQYNKELVAQGIGNIICGTLGALPMTAVIVRSTANVEAGAQSRLSTMLHGVWLLILILFFPYLLRLIPLSCLAAILVYTGYKLVNVAIIKELNDFGKSEVFIYIATTLGIVAFDLLIGVLLGLILSLFKLIITISHVEFEHAVDETDGTLHISMHGAATILTLPQLSTYFDTISFQDTKKIVVHVDDLVYIDHSCMDFLEGLIVRMEALGGELTIDKHRLASSIHQVYQERRKKLRDKLLTT